MRNIDREAARMDESKGYRKSARDAHKRANQAADSSRLHSNDLDQMVRSAKGARERLTDGQDRQREREQSSARTRRLRLEAVESQIKSALNYCSTAENAMAVLGRVDNARGAIEKARHVAEVVRAHVNEPNHVPADSVAGINQRLTELDTRISSIKARFPKLAN